MSDTLEVIEIQKKYFIKFKDNFFDCQIGSNGIVDLKIKLEGDKATPRGQFELNTIYYRHDKMIKLDILNNKFISFKKITKNCGWCDDHKSQSYNKYCNIDKMNLQGEGYEKLWREDSVYDILIETNHNSEPTLKNKGSAIFIHCSFSDLRSTAGCIALKKKDLIYLLTQLKKRSYINIY